MKSLFNLCLTDLGEVSSRNDRGQSELGNSDHLHNLHHLPGTNEGG